MIDVLDEYSEWKSSLEWLFNACMYSKAIQTFEQTHTQWMRIEEIEEQTAGGSGNSGSRWVRVNWIYVEKCK